MSNQNLLVNKNGYMFAVDSAIELNLDDLATKGVIIAADKEKMVEKAAEITGEPAETLSGAEYVIGSTDGKLHITDMRGVQTPLEQSDLSDYLVNYIE